MPLPVVIVEVAPTDVAAEHANALTETCSAAIRRGTCVIAHLQSEKRAPDALAVVSWYEDGQRARIQVGIREPRNRWMHRDLRFRNEDAPVERWRAVGLVIATLVGELPGPLSRATPEPGPESDEASSLPVFGAPRPLPAQVKTLPPRALPPVSGGGTSSRFVEPWVEAGALVGPGLDTGAPRWGGWLGVSFDVQGFELAPFVLASYARRSQDDAGVSASWLRGWVGMAVPIMAEPIELALRVGPLFERIHATALFDGEEDAAWQFVLGAGGALEARWPARGAWSTVFSGDLWWLSNDLGIRVAGVPRGRFPVIGGGLRMGLRLSLF